MNDFSLQILASWWSSLISQSCVMLLVAIVATTTRQTHPRLSLVLYSAIGFSCLYAMSPHLSDLHIVFDGNWLNQAVYYAGWLFIWVIGIAILPRIYESLSETESTRVVSTLSAFAIISSVGTAVLKEPYWNDPHRSYPEYIRVTIRDISYNVSPYDSLWNELLRPTEVVVTHGVTLLFLFLVTWLVIRACGGSPQNAFIVSSVVHSAFTKPFILESMIAFASASICGYVYQREVGRSLNAPSRKAFTRGVVATITDSAISGVLYILIIKDVFAASQHRWDLVCTGFVVNGIVLGRLWSYAMGNGRGRRPSTLTIDELLYSVQLKKRQMPLIRVRLDTAVALAPFIAIGVVLLVAAYLREWSLPMIHAACSVLLLFIVTIAAVATVGNRYTRTHSVQPVEREQQATMRQLSLLAYSMGTIDYVGFVFGVVLPVTCPLIVSLCVGGNAALFVVMAVLSVLGCWFASTHLLDWYHSQPPSIVILGASGKDSVLLHSDISRRVAPLRAVSLLAISEPAVGEGRLPPQRDSLRTIWNPGWIEVVASLCGMAPIVVLDSRRSTQAVLDELRVLIENGWISKTVVVTQPDGSTPLLDGRPIVEGERPLAVCIPSATADCVMDLIKARSSK